MTPEAQRIAIAKACGFKDIRREVAERLFGNMDWFGTPLQGTEFEERVQLPRYLKDLNAMHEAEKVLTPKQRCDYMDFLDPQEQNGWDVCHATASQRAEAFLRTLNLWKEADR